MVGLTLKNLRGSDGDKKEKNQTTPRSSPISHLNTFYHTVVSFLSK